VTNCCSEAGTLAVSRPDISQAMLSRKRQSTTAAEPAPGTIYATNCPSCLTGLGRNRQLGVVPRHLAVLLAEAEGGSAWQEGFAAIAARAEKVTF
jgi:Fe-S oxidoreductase